MNYLDKRLRTAEAYRIIATELDHHFANGSEFLHLEPDGSESPEGVVRLRFAVLKRAVRLFERRAFNLERL